MRLPWTVETQIATLDKWRAPQARDRFTASGAFTGAEEDWLSAAERGADPVRTSIAIAAVASGDSKVLGLADARAAYPATSPPFWRRPRVRWRARALPPAEGVAPSEGRSST